MDATYKTTKYAIPVFFVCVHGNTGYTIVAKFLCQIEDSGSIEEDLELLQTWNEFWTPKYFVVDFSFAIKKSFPDVSVCICDFHRIEAWQRWLRTAKNGLSHESQNKFLRLMQKIV